MKDYNRANTIDTYFEKIETGNLEFSKLRKTLEKENIEKDEINIIVPLIDRKLIRASEIKADRAKGKNMFYGGLILSGLGLIFTIGTLTGLIDLNGVGIIAYGPIAGGLLTVIAGKAKMNRDY
ncbi:hypothetical protein [Tenacibaculum sp. M341]|uniref:hypothetical protein n=1 Tax=Tenacibaculum sp. M341 TaxID=2530339 RepID=UPI001044B845|nr:hypothetical protein [Tenacibaculum sp. M341]TCI84850.1 hypothetical protein EYW44_19125 [Tenacibaculum sp. M341]